MEISSLDCANIHMLAGTMNKVKQEMKRDETLQELSAVILKGWPTGKVQVSVRLTPFWNMRDSLTVYEGVIYNGNKVLIPKAMQAEMLTRIHKSHKGAESCIRKAHDVLFWVGMTAQIRDVCTSCSVCAAYAVQHQREPMLSNLVPDLPWQKISQDIFYLQGKSYLVTVDLIL